MSKLHRDNAGYVGCSYEETQDPYYSYNKLALPLSESEKTIVRDEVTLTVTTANGKFVIDGVSQASLSLKEGVVYKFDQSAGTNAGHPLRFSITSDGTHSRGTEYYKGVTYVGVPGTSGAYTELVVPFAGIDLYYYCKVHPNMGSSAATPANSEMFTRALPILKSTDKFGQSGLVGGSIALAEGDPSSATDNPFGSGHSVAFDGNDRIRFLGGTIVGDFTYECWFKMDSGTSGFRRIMSTNESTYSTEQTMIRVKSDGNIQFYAGNGTPEDTGGAVSASTWYHAAIVRSGDTVSYYFNGSRTDTDTYSASNNISLTQVCLGWGYGTGEYFTGKVSNARVSNNARYSGTSLTVPTATFTSDSNTLLLAAHTSNITYVEGSWTSNNPWAGTEDPDVDPYAANLVLAVPMNGANNGTPILDKSADIRGTGSNKAITLFAGSSSGGGVTSTDQSKYYGSSFYAVRGGVNSNQSDYITRTGDADLAFGKGDFTVEFWFYPASLVSNYVIFDNRHPTTGWPNSSNGFALIGNSSGTIHVYTGGNNFISADYAIQNQANQWHHIAISREDSFTSLFINGERKGDIKEDLNDYNEGRFTLGSSSPNGEGVTGYFNDLRIYKGVAKYKPEQSGHTGFQAVRYSGLGAAINRIGANIFSNYSAVSGGTVADADKAFNGSGANWTNLTASSTTTAASVDFQFTYPIHGVTKIEAAFDSPSGSGDTRGRYNGANSGATRTGTGSGYSDIYSGAGITVSSVGFAINQNGASGTNNDIVSRFRITDSSGTYILVNGQGQYIPFQPDFVWLKNDGSYTGHHVLYDSVRGVNKHLRTSDTGTEYTEDADRSLTKFNVDGFTIDTSGGEHVGAGNINLANDAYVAYCWKAGGAAAANTDGSGLTNVQVSANDAHGFSIVTYTGGGSGTANTDSGDSFGHGLSTAPKLVICKRRNSANGWPVYHASTALGALNLYSQDDVDTASYLFAQKHPTSSVVYLGNNPEINALNSTYVAYCFSDVENYQKISSYTGGGSNTVTVTTGFRPQFLLIKGNINGEDWVIMDDARSKAMPANDAFFANTGAVPSANSAYNVYFLDDGFRIHNNNPRWNTQGQTYYYMAIGGSKATDPKDSAFKFVETLDLDDLSASGNNGTNNGASFQTSIKKFYGGAAAFASGQYLTVPDSTELRVGTGDFTIEVWMHPTSYGSASYPSVISKYSDSDLSWILRLHSSGQLVWYNGASAGTNSTSASGLSLLNQWSHIAVVRQAGVSKIYLNGSQVLSVADTYNYDDSNPLVVGRQDLSNNNPFIGYLQDFRLYKGIAKYTSSFSPPERSVQGTARRYPSGVYVVS